MPIHRGSVYWVDLGEPLGSEPGYRRPVLVIQENPYNASRLATTIVLSLTSNTGLSGVPGCVVIPASESGLPKDSVANATQLRTIDKTRMDNYVGTLNDETMFMIEQAIRSVLGV
ncbi:MAG: type II toxin-antitoxin system PemK/MazF family toxin [Planctomycetota bacterium]|nr:MAG: type II toxin-antitoxin system PemK/MazF family toxin [Planctomycetota bacterium]